MNHGQAAFEAFQGSLPAEEKEGFEIEAIAAAPSFLQKQYLDGKAAQGTLWRVARQRIPVAHHARTSQVEVKP